MSEPLALLRVGMCCPVGLDAAQTASSLRAGVSRKSETHFLDRAGQPVILGHLREQLLPPLDPALAPDPDGATLEPRLLRLAAGPLAEALAPAFATAPVPLYLAGPRRSSLPGEPPYLSPRFLEQLAAQAKRGLDLEASRVLAEGAAGFFAAIAAARDEQLVPKRAEFVVVGGVDSHFDVRRLAELERAGRLRTSGPRDAFTPGEAAAFAVLARASTCRRLGLKPLAWITAVSQADDDGPTRPGLASACAAVLEQGLAPDDRVRLVFAGLNGELGSARDWSVALLRSRSRFADALRIEHPAEAIGDAGAALAPLMLATAAIFMRKGVAPGPALVWACAKSEGRGALILAPREASPP